MARKGFSVFNAYLIILLLLTALLVVGSGCPGHNDDYDYKLEVTETRTWPVSNITQITASTENGNIEVSASQDTVITAVITRRCYGENKADAENYIDNVVVEDSIASSVLTITADMPDNGRNYAASFEIFAPESTYLNLASVNGNLSLTNTIAGANLLITNGNISTQNLRGSINGVITNGNTDCDYALLAAGESVVLVTTNGNVQLSLPSDVSATFDAQTTNGTVAVTGFPSVSYTINETNHKAGTIGTGPGGATISMIAVNGNVTISAR